MKLKPSENEMGLLSNRKVIAKQVKVLQQSKECFTLQKKIVLNSRLLSFKSLQFLSLK